MESWHWGPIEKTVKWQLSKSNAVYDTWERMFSWFSDSSSNVSSPDWRTVDSVIFCTDGSLGLLPVSPRVVDPIHTPKIRIRKNTEILLGSIRVAKNSCDLTPSPAPKCAVKYCASQCNDLNCTFYLLIPMWPDESYLHFDLRDATSIKERHIKRTDCDALQVSSFFLNSVIKFSLQNA